MKVEFLDTTDHMEYGHEGWLEPNTTHVHEGDPVEIYFKWGHNMQAHGLARKEGLSAHVLLPDGQKQQLEIQDYKPSSYLMQFTPKEIGLYHFICHNKGYYVIDKEGKHLRGTLKDYPDSPKATSFTQFSHLTMLVGHDLSKEQLSTSPRLPLAIVPEEWKKWKTGEDINFTLYLNKDVLPENDIDLACAEDEESSVEQMKMKTDGKGKLNINVEKIGQYLLIARHHSNEGETGVYYDTQFTYTYYYSIKK
ncbi:DUF4198 domain-containing protein [Desulfosporosinus sp. OT]|uniref:DUF4198 domain-containing protein n=1 Tax=Desulfosporosinus sp. OT TaxID=913865 RepID=UPI0002E4E622|nr:DUF4198 domain-containing protein [Desulfosporosinus sp. OT]